jgi:hypothetical protein
MPNPARAWIHVSPSGESSVVSTDKATLCKELGIQQRDLRVLESTMANQVRGG